ncbi:MAG: formate/nitrite transporter family protein [Planctomycetes bacterium]|nr:formate/nitrite transporter family protein [Planctomycetota bacterium]
MGGTDDHDAYAPPEIAARVASVGVAKAGRDFLGTLVLAVLAGAFIALGGLLYCVVVTGSELGFGPTRLLGGLAFSLGLVLVIVAGAELFTGNNLIAMAWASRLVTTGQVLRNWAIVYVGNLLGALGTFALAWAGRVHELGGGGVGRTLAAIGAHKTALEPLQAFALGVLCNGLVCLAVWLTLAGRSVTDKVLAIVFPITAFVAMGFEHSIANMFFLPYALALDGFADAALVRGAVSNLLLVTAGNMVGGTVLVAGVYWLAYLRGKKV